VPKVRKSFGFINNQGEQLMTASITVVGNLTADPELRYTQGGLAVASFTIASTKKKFDKATNEWVDGKTLFMRCSAWRELGEHIAGSLTKGTRVIAVGEISTREWEDKEGGKRSSIEMDVDAIGPDLRYSTASVTRASSANRGTTGATTEEPWATTPPVQTDSTQPAWNTPGNYSDETPF
jgi:single-strand DNA-binding protein